MPTADSRGVKAIKFWFDHGAASLNITQKMQTRARHIAFQSELDMKFFRRFMLYKKWQTESQQESGEGPSDDAIINSHGTTSQMNHPNMRFVAKLSSHADNCCTEDQATQQDMVSAALCWCTNGLS